MLVKTSHRIILPGRHHCYCNTKSPSTLPPVNPVLNDLGGWQRSRHCQYPHLTTLCPLPSGLVSVSQRCKKGLDSRNLRNKTSILPSLPPPITYPLPNAPIPRSTASPATHHQKPRPATHHQKPRPTTTGTQHQHTLVRSPRHTDARTRASRAPARASRRRRHDHSPRAGG